MSSNRTRYSKRITLDNAGDKEVGTKAPSSGVEFDLDAFLTEVKNIESNVERSDDDKNAMVALDVTKAHFERCCEDEKIYINALASVCKFIFMKIICLGLYIKHLI